MAKGIRLGFLETFAKRMTCSGHMHGVAQNSPCKLGLMTFLEANISEILLDQQMMISLTTRQSIQWTSGHIF